MKQRLYELAVAEEWVTYAVENIEQASKSFSDPSSTPRHVAFFKQQALEIAFKSVLISEGTQVAFTHELSDIRDLMHPTAQKHIKLDSRELQTISQWATLGRYPPGIHKAQISRSDVEKVISKAVTCVNDLVDHIHKTLSKTRNHDSGDDHLLGR